MARADYIMLGGFLGAGKTTAILALADWLSSRGRRVGLITNDQSVGLVDTAMLSAHGYPVEEITGGCFCCRFNSLMEASERLTEEAKPDVFLAEPVGSCTDLRAAVSHPLRRLYGGDFRVAPLSVMVDPVRASRVLGLERGTAFSPKVRYVYEKQLEEAEILVINKEDLVDAEQLTRLREALASRYPRAEVLTVSARERRGLDAWFTRILGNEAGDDPAPDIDYEEYAEGEALLGWYNGTFSVRAASGAGTAVAATKAAGAGAAGVGVARVAAGAPAADDDDGVAGFDGNTLLTELAGGLQQRFEAKNIEIAHLKMTFSPEGFGNDIAVLNLVRTDGRAELSHTLRDEAPAGQLIVNLRAEGPPETIHAIAGQAVAEVMKARGLTAAVDHEESFSPAKPNPTYRMATV